jgi:superoxide reductase
MTKRLETYRCNICGNITVVFNSGNGQLICCGQPMEKLVAKIKEEGYEKHLPVIEEKGEETLIKIGSNPHPMGKEHFIQWINVITKKGCICTRFLKPGQRPEAKFKIKKDKIKLVHEYCNIHGLWQTKNNY